MLEYNRDHAILFLVFNRIDTTSKVFEAIKEAAPKRLYVAADGSRNADEQERCNLVRAIATDITWNCELKTLFREENLGCRDAVSGALDWFFDQEEEGIILEDDCLPSASFFGFCSSLLEKYRYDERIAQISGSNLQIGIKRGDASYYFTRLPNIWGWATWRRTWKKYDVNMSSFPYFTEADLANSPSHAPFKETWYRNLLDTYNKKIDTWDYQFCYATIINNYLSITPNQNLISNIGFRADATHTTGDHTFANLETEEMESLIHPRFFIPNVEADLYVQKLVDPPPVIIRKNFLSRTWKKVKGK